MKVPRITREDLLKKIDSKEDITLIDVRNDADYSSSAVKIPGALRIPLEELEARVKELNPSREAVTYCT